MTPKTAQDERAYPPTPILNKDIESKEPSDETSDSDDDTPALALASQEEENQEKTQCEVCLSGGDLWPCHVCRKQIHIKCA